MIGKIPELPELTLHDDRRVVAEPTVVQFVDPREPRRFVANKSWGSRAMENIKSLNLIGIGQKYFDDSDDDHIDNLNETAWEFCLKVNARLPEFVDGRIPADRPDLQLGKHWLWDSFTKKLPKLSQLVVLQGHQARDLHYRTARESLLTSDMGAFPLATSDDFKDCDGNYVQEDSERGEFIRVGAACATFGKREPEHEAASRLESDATKSRRFYRSYPHKEARDMPSAPLGFYQQLKMRVGIAVEKSKMQEVVDLFDWDETELAELEKLPSRSPSSPDTLLFKQYRHLCYLFELMYAVAINPNRNITESTTCEWQLRLYSKKK